MKINLQDFNATPIENKAKRGCSRRQLFRHHCQDKQLCVVAPPCLPPVPARFSHHFWPVLRRLAFRLLAITNAYKIRFLKQSHDAIRNNTVPVLVSVQTAKEECRQSKIQEFNGTYLHKSFRLLRILLDSGRHRILQCWCIKRWGHTRFVIRLHIHPCLKYNNSISVK